MRVQGAFAAVFCSRRFVHCGKRGSKQAREGCCARGALSVVNSNHANRSRYCICAHQEGQGQIPDMFQDKRQGKQIPQSPLFILWFASHCFRRRELAPAAEFGQIRKYYGVHCEVPWQPAFSCSRFFFSVQERDLTSVRSFLQEFTAALDEEGNFVGLDKEKVLKQAFPTPARSVTCTQGGKARAPSFEVSAPETYLPELCCIRLKWRRWLQVGDCVQRVCNEGSILWLA